MTTLVRIDKACGGRSIIPVVSKGTPALVTWASIPLARSRASNCAGYAPWLPTLLGQITQMHPS
jgi:hypothetical protein